MYRSCEDVEEQVDTFRFTWQEDDQALLHSLSLSLSRSLIVILLKYYNLFSQKKSDLIVLSRSGAKSAHTALFGS